MNTKGKAQQKLAVLPYLHELFYNHCMIGISLNGGVYIESDYFVGNTKAFISVGFRNNKNEQFSQNFSTTVKSKNKIDVRAKLAETAGVSTDIYSKGKKISDSENEEVKEKVLTIQF